MAADPSGLREPLLPSSPLPWQQQPPGLHHAVEVVEELPRSRAKSSMAISCLNLTNTILGAGMFALPAAFAGLGLLGGVVMVAAVGAMTYFSVVVMLRSSERSGQVTYTSTMDAWWGRPAALAVRASIILACGGFLILYLIILVDVVVGAEDYTGVIPDLFPSLPYPLPWYLSRSAMLTWFVLAVAPLLSARTLGGLARVSAFKVAFSLVCMTALVVLAVAAGRQGKLHTRLLPDPEMFGPGFAKALTQALATVPVVMTALICQYNIYPLVQDLKNYTKSRMRRVVAYTLTGCSLVYTLAGAAGYAVFGRAVKGDVLASMDPDVVGELLGSPRVGLVFVATLKTCVAFVMITSFPMVNFALRADLIDMIQGVMGGKALGNKGFYTVTYVTLLLVYLSAILIKSAYQMTGLVGAVCGIAVGFIFPGMLCWRGEKGWSWRLFAAVLLVVGTVLMVAGIVAPLLDEGDGAAAAAVANAAAANPLLARLLGRE